MQRIAFAVAVLTVGLWAATAEAALVTSFSRTTNDGVYTINAGQAAFLGVAGADRVGFFRVRNNSMGTTYGADDTFNQTSILNTTNDDSKILGLFNGRGDVSRITYTGASFAPLGTTTLLASLDVFEGVLFAFSSLAGNIVFTGSTTFNGSQTRGNADFIAPIPAAAWLFGSALLGLGAYARRRRRREALAD